VKETAYEKVCGILTGRFEVPAESVHPDASFGQLELDSLAVVELQFLFEETFGVELWAEEFDPKMTIAEVVQQLTANPLEV
jgi:acyl carrier protein